MLNQFKYSHWYGSDKLQRIPTISVQILILYIKSPTLNAPNDLLTPFVTLYAVRMFCKSGTISPGMLADIDTPICTFFCKMNINTQITLSTHHNKMHLMTFNPDHDLIWGFQFGQQGKISSGMVADIDKPSGTLYRKNAYASQKMSLKPPVYDKSMGAFCCHGNQTKRQTTKLFS